MLWSTRMLAGSARAPTGTTSHYWCMPEKPERRRLDEIFGVEPLSEPEPEHDADSGEEHRREREFLENRPPHHDER